MKPAKSKELLTKFLNALSTEDVDVILDQCRFEDSDWLPYGGREKNWDTVSTQQTNGVGALTELITNSIDAVLSRKAYESGLKDLSSDDAPTSMQDAVRKFYDVNEGKLSSLATKQLTDLAKKSILIGVKRKKKGSTTPTITVVDFGEGQNPEDFEKTFLSLSETNKEGIGFVQGKFNMGSTGSIPFCTESDVTKGHYKLIVSKRYDTDVWGWTLIKVSQVEKGKKLPIVKFLKPDGAIPSFQSKTIEAFGHNKIGVISEGSLVRLFDYDIGDGAHQVDLGLYEALTLNLLDCALPVRLYDFNAQPTEGKGDLRKEGIADRTFSGMNVMLHADIVDSANQNPEIKDKKPDRRTTEFVHLVSEIDDDELGKIRIIATGFSEWSNALKRTKKRVFYTINGQTHATKNASFLNTKDIGLGDLQNNIVINIECEAMDQTALATIFAGNREQAKNVRLFRELEAKVKGSLKDDPKLKQYQKSIRLRRAFEIIENDEETKKLLSDLITKDPAIKELLGLGSVASAPVIRPGGTKEWDAGKQFPTFLNPLNATQEDGEFIKEVPINTTRQVKCGTDAANDYLTRSNSPGWKYIDSSPNIKTSIKLHNGVATFTFAPPAKIPAEVGGELLFNIGFDDHGPKSGPLTFPLKIKFVKAETTQKKRRGSSSDTKDVNKESVADPTEWVKKADWDGFSFDGKSGATVRDIGNDGIKIHVNRDHDILKDMRSKETDEAKRNLNENRFKIGLGFLTLAIYKYHKNDEDAVEKSESSSNAIALYILALIRTLGEGNKL